MYANKIICQQIISHFIFIKSSNHKNILTTKSGTIVVIIVNTKEKESTSDEILIPHLRIAYFSTAGNFYLWY